MLQNYSTWNVFALFAQNPTQSFQIREISRLIGLAPPSVVNHLKYLQKEGLVVRRKVGVYPAYVASRENEQFKFYKQLYNLTALKESGLVEYLEKKLTPDVIMLFGSYAKAEDTENSDIDLYVQASERRFDLKSYEKKLQRSIQLFFQDKVSSLPNELRLNVINGIKLAGFLRWKS